MKLNKHQRRRIANERDIRHTLACRSKPGNIKGDGGHLPLQPGHSPLGGYRCICDWMERILVNIDALENTSDALTPEQLEI